MAYPHQKLRSGQITPSLWAKRESLPQNNPQFVDNYVDKMVESNVKKAVIYGKRGSAEIVQLF